MSIERTITEPTKQPTSDSVSEQSLSRIASVQRFVGSIYIRLRTYGLIVLLDIVIVAIAFETAVLLRFMDTPQVSAPLLQMLIPSLLVGWLYAAVSYFFGLHRRLWLYASLPEGIAIVKAVAITMVIATAVDLVNFTPLVTWAKSEPGLSSLAQYLPSEGKLGYEHPLPMGVMLVGAGLSLLFVGALKFMPRIIATDTSAKSRERGTRMLIVGAGLAGSSLMRSMAHSDLENYAIVGFLDDDASKWGRRIGNKPVMGDISMLSAVVDAHNVDLIAVALPSASRERISEVLTLCQSTQAKIKIMPSVHEMVGAKDMSISLREVHLADLLGREAVPLQSAWAHANIAGKTVLVTGAAGSIGSELCRQLLQYKPAKVVALDNNETGLFDLAASLRQEDDAERLSVHIGDIRDEHSMAHLFETARPYAVFHAAAYKHVPLLEQHPDEAARTNVLGTYHLCRLARQHRVARFVFISTDKAADPVNVLGVSKRIGEMMVQRFALEGGDTRFCAVRFGNVIGSRGSVIPTFTQQIEQGGPVTVTDPMTTRYFMTIPEACGLVIVTAGLASIGGLYILDMGEPVRIADVATKMIRMRGLRVDKDVAIAYTGLRPGERLHEVLVDADVELETTEHGKIFHAPPQMNVPTDDQIATEIESLQGKLATGDMKDIRAQLFTMVEPHRPAAEMA